MSEEEKKYYHKINNLEIQLEDKHIMIYQWAVDFSHKWAIASFKYDEEYFWKIITYGEFDNRVDWYDFGCLVNLGYKWLKELGWE